MPGVIAKKNESFEKLFRRFKRTVEKADVINELRRREFHEKPTAMRKRKRAAAIKRWERKRGELNIGGIKKRLF